MKSFANRMAVVTGGGGGIGRELVRQLLDDGCHVTFCDVSTDHVTDTLALLAPRAAAHGLKLSGHLADVSDPVQVAQFRKETAAAMGADSLDLLINNAGVNGGASFITSAQDEWERTFDICWGGVYNCTRAFMPMLLAAQEARLVNVSSVNGFWAALLPNKPSTAYSAAKFAVKGFTEALIADLAMHAPHVKCSLVMPGHIGTGIVGNSDRILGGSGDRRNPTDAQAARNRVAAFGVEIDGVEDDAIPDVIEALDRQFAASAAVSPEQAAKTILDGIRAGRWRILVGDDASAMDEIVRADPDSAYRSDFNRRLHVAMARSASRASPT